jgi:hypothetical protein
MADSLAEAEDRTRESEGKFGSHPKTGGYPASISCLAISRRSWS